jgi:excisionase family DNA binding protein
MLNPETNNRVYMSAAAAAKLLGVSPKTVSRWALTDPTMPTTRIGRSVRFDGAALHRWLTCRGRAGSSKRWARKARAACKNARKALAAQRWAKT